MEEDMAWLAGYMEGVGSLSLTVEGRPVYRINTSTNFAAIRKFSQLSGRKVYAGKSASRKETLRVTITGGPLHELMRKVWPHLSDDRKREYARLRKASSSR